MTTILAVRHAQASFGAANYDKLSPLGETQSQKLGLWLRQIGFTPDQVLTGGMYRHAQTANIALDAMGQSHEITSLEAFGEYDHSDVLTQHDPDFQTRLMAHIAEGKKSDMSEFQQGYAKAVSRWIGGAFDAHYRLSWPQFQSRVRSGLDQLAQIKDAKNVLLITSGGPLTVMFQALTGVDDISAFATGHRLLNCGISRLQIQDQGLKLNSFNAVPHLEIACDPNLLTYV